MGEQVEKDIAIFAISALKVESFMHNVRDFNLRLKVSSLDWHLKNYCHIWNVFMDVWQGSEYLSELASKFKDVPVLN